MKPGAIRLAAIFLKPNHPFTGFTLIEVLAVIAIIGVLAVLLFPAFGNLTKHAFAAKSASNLRQTHVAAQGWSADNNGVIVPCYTPGDGVANSPRHFTALLAPYLRIDTNLFSKNAPSDASFTLAPQMPVYVYPGHPQRFGYGYNYAYLSIVNTGQGWNRQVPLAGVAHPSQTVFLVTCKSNAADDEAFLSWRSFVRPPSVYKSLKDHVPAFESPGNTAQVLWLDGHITQETEEHLMADDALWDLE
ncbi:MAG: type II secretion system protein [Terrimicrobiaceae bacterium]